MDSADFDFVSKVGDFWDEGLFFVYPLDDSSASSYTSG